MFSSFKKKEIKQKLILEDIYAASVFVSPIQNRLKKPVNFSQYSVRPYVVAILANEILLNGRKNYLEFGGGISTVLLAKFIEINDLGTRIIMIDHDKEWTRIVASNLEAEGLSKNVSIIHAPLVETNSPFGKIDWYDKSKILSVVRDFSFDLIFVDGPPGKSGFHRYGALPFLSDNRLFAEYYAFYLDDSFRKQEQKIVTQWEKESDKKFSKVLEHLAYYQSGDSLKVKLTNN